MKSILLTSTALIALGGAAFADGHATAGVTFAGGATLSYNDIGDTGPDAVAFDDDGKISNGFDDIDEGFSWDADLAITLTAPLNNGLVATAEFGVEFADNNRGQDLTSEDYLLTLESDIAKLQFGDVDPVAESRFEAVDGAAVIDFYDKDVHFDGIDASDDYDIVTVDGLGFDAMMVAEAELYGITAAVSFGVNPDADINDSVDELDAMQLYVAGSFGNVDVAAAYQAEIDLGDGANTPAIFGLSAETSFAGADVKVSYVMQDEGVTLSGNNIFGDADASDAVVAVGEESSFGVNVAYPIGPVVLGGYYTLNDEAEDNFGVSADYVNGGIAVNAAYEVDGGEGDADDVATYSIDASYDTMIGLIVYAGLEGTDVDDTDVGFYAGANYDLGGGAEVFVSYADDGNDDSYNDEFGGRDYTEGTTVGVSFSF